MEPLTRKFAYLWLRSVEVSVNCIIWIYARFYKKKSNTELEIKSIGAFWNLPPDLTGSNLRMGAWKSLFEKDGFVYHNYHINQFEEYINYVEKGTRTQRYIFFAKCITRRLPQILKSHHYDCVWIDRGIIPFYPRKNAFIEKQMKRVVTKLVVDTTDGGDYQNNPKLMEHTLQQAHEITVGYKHLREFYESRFKVNQIFWTIPDEKYIVKANSNLNKPPVIGWMGSPGNFSYVRSLIPQLQILAKQVDFVFRYVCRQNFDSELDGIACDHHYYDEHYYERISSFDIGISPFLKNDLRSKGKIAMKHQEFLLMGVPQVCSPVAISEFVEHEKHVLIAQDIEQWQVLLLTLLTEDTLRQELSENSKTLFNSHYTYQSQYSKLKRVLTNC